MAIQNTARVSSQVTSQSGDNVDVVTFSNVSEVEQIDIDVTVTKTASKGWVLPEGELTLTTTITNKTNKTIENFKFKDTLIGATFVAGSVKIGNVLHENLDPLAGFDMQVTLGAGADVSVSYTIKAEKLPAGEIVKSRSVISFTLDGETFDVASNEEVVEVLFSGLTVLKTSTPTAAIKGSILTYTIDITNDGTRDNTAVVFSDTLPAELSFVENSITVNGSPQPTYTLDNIQLGNLNPGDSVTVTFKATVN